MAFVSSAIVLSNSVLNRLNMTTGEMRLLKGITLFGDFLDLRFEMAVFRAFFVCEVESVGVKHL